MLCTKRGQRWRDRCYDSPRPLVAGILKVLDRDMRVSQEAKKVQMRRKNQEQKAIAIALTPGRRENGPFPCLRSRTDPLLIGRGFILLMYARLTRPKNAMPREQTVNKFYQLVRSFFSFLKPPGLNKKKEKKEKKTDTNLSFSDITTSLRDKRSPKEARPDASNDISHALHVSRLFSSNYPGNQPRCC